MKPLFLGVCALAAVLCGCSKPAALLTSHKTVADLAVMLVPDTAPHAGDNVFSVTLTDAVTHAPIGNANLTAIPEMLSQTGTGSPSSGRAQGDGLYKVPMRLGIATRYDIALHIERPGKPAADVSFPVEAAQ